MTPGPAAASDRITAVSGRFVLPAIDALVRLPVVQSRRDRAAGRRIGTFVTGYPGSPLAGLDLALARHGAVLADHGIVHVPGANEELAATAVMGTQMLDGHPHERYEGVVSFWYGKGPGVDRSGDALKHGNFAGTSRHGAVVVLSGEDHEAKSSTMPFQEDFAFQAAGIPVLAPGTVADILTLGLHAVALSRFSGCWVALKLVAPLCDSAETVDVALQPEVQLPVVEIDGVRFTKRSDFGFFPGATIETERHLYEERHAAVAAYARANGLDRLEVHSERDQIAIVAAGKSYVDVRQALAGLGLPDDALRRAGIRLARVGLVYPLERSAAWQLADGVDQVIVVEEKRAFLEDQLRAALCDLGRPVQVLGKRDEAGRPLFPGYGGLDADGVAERLGRLLAPRLTAEEQARVGRRLDELAGARRRGDPIRISRTANYCSGCPHSTSTRLAPGQVAWGSPGCHSFASVIEQPERQVQAMTQFGGEGVPWIGLAPFTERRHMVQNVGDGSLFHSSYLNIRFCVAAGVDITFKILYNGFVANTGAQEPVGAASVPALAGLLALEGVRRVAIVTKAPSTYRRAGLPPEASLHRPSEVVALSAELAGVKGVTVLLYDETCANERRRRQRRGLLPRPQRFVLINERVCEGCGDCGRVSNCMSLEEVGTAFGPKTRVNPSSCNQDFACLAGDCPSFATVTTAPGTGYARVDASAVDDVALPEPAQTPPGDEPYHVVIPGVGGTGVITLNAVLAAAAAAEGWQVCSYDQTGAAQKWGPVLSSLVLTPPGRQPVERSVGAERAELYLACDLISAAAAANLVRCHPRRTAAVLNTTIFPTGEMVRDVTVRPSADELCRAIVERVDERRAVRVAARELAETLVGGHEMANLVVLGAAYQAGLLPVSARSIEAAVAANQVAVEQNLRAFRYGRWWVHDPAAVTAVLTRRQGQLAPSAEAGGPGDPGRLRRRRRSVPVAGRHLLDVPTRALVQALAADLVGYQSRSWARRYMAAVEDVAGREQRLGLSGSGLTEAVARSLHKLMTYKDEYEVARLYTSPAWRQQVRTTFDRPVSVAIHLHPPLLRALGLRRKIALGPSFVPVLWLLARLRVVRGTPLDPFGGNAQRREERELISWYRQLVDEALDVLDRGGVGAVPFDGASAGADPVALALEVARLPQQIRGYEQLKHRRAVEARQRGAELLAQQRLAAGIEGESADDRSRPA